MFLGYYRSLQSVSANLRPSALILHNFESKDPEGLSTIRHHAFLMNNSIKCAEPGVELGLTLRASESGISLTIHDNDTSQLY